MSNRNKIKAELELTPSELCTLWHRLNMGRGTFRDHYSKELPNNDDVYQVWNVLDGLLKAEGIDPYKNKQTRTITETKEIDL